MQKRQTHERANTCVRQSPMKAGWWDAPLALPFRDLAKAIPIISANELPLLTENNFQSPPLPSSLYLDPPPPFIDIEVICWTPLLLRPHFIIWNWRVENLKRKNAKAGEYEELGRALFKRFISASNIPMSELVLREKGNDLAKKTRHC